MAETDTPLKRLMQTAAHELASWLLGEEVQEIEAVNVELPGEVVRVDQLYRVTLVDGRRTLLHIEFQGKSSARPMR